MYICPQTEILHKTLIPQFVIRRDHGCRTALIGIIEAPMTPIPPTVVVAWLIGAGVNPGGGAETDAERVA